VKPRGKPNTSSLLRKKAEKKLLDENKRLKKLSAIDSERLVHELATHQIELQMQNAELRGAQEELEVSRTKYSELFDFAPSVISPSIKMHTCARSTSPAQPFLESRGAF